MSKLLSHFPPDLCALMRACVRGSPRDLAYLGAALDKPDQLQLNPPNLKGLFASLVRVDGSEEVSPEVEALWDWLS